MIDTLLSDLRYSVRMFAKNPGFTFFAIGVLALGIAASTAIFSIADTVLVRPLPYRHAENLVLVWEDASAYGFPQDTPSPGNFSDWSSRNQVFEGMAAISDGSFNLTRDGNPEQITGEYATANLFSILGVSPALGRSFRPEDDVPGAMHVAIVSHGLWERRFGADPQIIGREIWLNGVQHIVIGVMPRGFLFPDRESDLWVPSQFTKENLADHGNHFLKVVARLKPGVSIQTANANLATIAQRLAGEYPNSNAKVGTFAVPLREHLAGRMRLALLVLLGAVSFVLLIACANVANLLLSRAAGRKRELAMRLTLGATRRRVIRQLLTESVLMASLAGIAGFVISIWAAKLLGSLVPVGIAPLGDVGVNAGALIFTIAVSVATGILFGIIPALRVSQIDLVTALKQGGGRAVGSGGQALRDTLVVSEVALAIILLVGASLMIRSFQNLYHLDPGFRTDHVIVMRTPLPEPKYDNFADRTDFYSQVLARVKSLPGVVAAGYTTWVPLTNSGGAIQIRIENHAARPGERLIPNTRVISKDYPSALLMKLVQGRLLDDRDGAETQPVALINQTMARNYWPGENALGKRFKSRSAKESDPWITVVGIVGDVHQAGLDLPPRPEMYLPYQQQSFFAPEYLAVRTSGNPMHLAETIRQQVWAVDKEQPVAGVMPLENLVSETLAPRRMQASLLGSFAGLALLLASLGIYAVLSFAVTQRTQEIGVRMALGAQRQDVLRMIVGHGLKLFLFGALLGLTATLALSRTLQHLLYGISATDPFSFAAVTLLLAGVTVAACYFPARRAMHVEPLVALRHE